MIANYTNHAANERTFLAWIRTGLAVAAFGFFVARLNVVLDVVAGARSLRPRSAFAAIDAAASRHVGLALGVIGILIVVHGGISFERTRRTIDRDELTRNPHSYAEPALSAALAIAAAIFCIYLAIQ